MVPLSQQAELFALKWAFTLAKDKTANIYTDNRYVSGVARGFGKLWKQRSSLPFQRNLN